MHYEFRLILSHSTAGCIFSFLGLFRRPALAVAFSYQPLPRQEKEPKGG
jgi:hypothetical protein